MPDRSPPSPRAATAPFTAISTRGVMRGDVTAPLANAACARCGGAFHCGAADPDPCACSTLLLSATLQGALRERWRGCLCLDCLRALAAQDTAGESPAAGGTRDPTPG